MTTGRFLSGGINLLLEIFRENVGVLEGKGLTEPMLALVNNREGLGTKVFEPCQVEYIGYGHSSGARTYLRTLVLLYDTRSP